MSDDIILGIPNEPMCWRTIDNDKVQIVEISKQGQKGEYVGFYKSPDQEQDAWELGARYTMQFDPKEW